MRAALGPAAAARLDSSFEGGVYGFAFNPFSNCTVIVSIEI
jgi:hypothetical protein